MLNKTYKKNSLFKKIINLKKKEFKLSKRLTEKNRYEKFKNSKQ